MKVFGEDENVCKAVRAVLVSTLSVRWSLVSYHTHQGIIVSLPTIKIKRISEEKKFKLTKREEYFLSGA